MVISSQCRSGRTEDIVFRRGRSAWRVLLVAAIVLGGILGDWREELFLRRKDNRAIRVYLTPEPTRHRFHTFMEDPVYRWSVATQNNGYNVPAEPGFYFGPELLDSAAAFRGTRLLRKVK
jgi:hypothetical protein